MKNLTLILLILLLITSCNKGTELPDLEASREELTVDHQGYDENGNAPIITLTANANWTAQSSSQWLSPNISTGGTRTLVTIKVKPNFTDSDREGTITFENEHAKVAVKVHQKYGNVDVSQIEYEVPVIFHIIYNEDDIRNPDEKKRRHALTSKELGEMLHQVNRLYGAPPRDKTEEEEDEKNLRERNNVPKLETRIRFTLAQEDKNGERLPNMGVTRTTIEEKFLDPYDVLRSKQDDIYHDMSWPIDRYINVFVFPFAPSGYDITDGGLILGIASRPYLPEHKLMPGLSVFNNRVSGFSNYNHCIVLNADAFETRVYENTFLGAKLGLSTLAHELGHYLGLLHTFTEISQEGGDLNMDACEDTDYCTDTPTYNRVAYIRTAKEILSTGGSYISQVEGLLRRTNCANTKFISTNIMDYEWSHSDRYTPEQVARMRHVLYYSPIVPGDKLIEFPETRSNTNELPQIEPHFSVCLLNCLYHH